MYLNSEQELWTALNNTSVKEFKEGLFLCGRDMDGRIDRILFHTLNRCIYEEHKDIPALRNIVIKEQYRKQGVFLQLIEKLESFNTPFMIDDVVNHEVLDPFFKKRGYYRYHYEKNEETIDCWIFQPK